MELCFEDSRESFKESIEVNILVSDFWAMSNSLSNFLESLLRFLMDSCSLEMETTDMASERA